MSDKVILDYLKQEMKETKDIEDSAETLQNEERDLIVTALAKLTISEKKALRLRL